MEKFIINAVQFDDDIDVLDINLRCYNVLMRKGLYTIRDILDLQISDLFDASLRKNDVKEICEKLLCNGFFSEKLMGDRSEYLDLDIYAKIEILSNKINIIYEQRVNILDEFLDFEIQDTDDDDEDLEEYDLENMPASLFLQ